MTVSDRTAEAGRITVPQHLMPAMCSAAARVAGDQGSELGGAADGVRDDQFWRDLASVREKLSSR